MRITLLLTFILLLLGCSTKGELTYITPQGEVKTACNTEYSGAPKVDIYAVEYVLSYCAKKAVSQGNKVEDQRLLSLDLTVPKAPNGEIWTFEYATRLYEEKQLSNKDYGYIIAYIDLGLATKN